MPRKTLTLNGQCRCKIRLHVPCRLMLVYIVHKNNFNTLPDDTYFDWSKLKAFSDKINLTEKLKLVLERVENIVGQGENAGYQHFLLFP